MGQLVSLKELDLYGNNLTSLPDALRNLSGTLILLDLQGNKNFSEVGEEGITLGKKELRDIFGSHVTFSDKEQVSFPTWVCLIILLIVVLVLLVLGYRYYLAK